MEVPKKLQMELPYDLEILLLSTSSRKIKSGYQIDTPMFIAS